MNEVAYTLSVGLACVFAWAGLAKARHPRRTRRAFAALGVGPGLARLVPAVEVVLAAGLVVAPVTGVVALLLLAAFSAVLARAGDGASCACFGTSSNAPVSWVQLLRNGLLAAVALVAATSTPQLPGVAAVLTATGVGATGALLLALAELKRGTGAVLGASLP